MLSWAKTRQRAPMAQWRLYIFTSLRVNTKALCNLRNSLRPEGTLCIYPIYENVKRLIS
jgi:hypothetical protein